MLLTLHQAVTWRDGTEAGDSPKVTELEIGWLGAELGPTTALAGPGPVSSSRSLPSPGVGSRWPLASWPWELGGWGQDKDPAGGPTLKENSSLTRNGKVTACRMRFSFRVCSICFSFTTCGGEGAGGGTRGAGALPPVPGTRAAGTTGVPWPARPQAECQGCSRRRPEAARPHGHTEQSRQESSLIA